ncbi:baseplate J/gp47 family protein [Loktanella agnita]|uniref:baseplate J/gp47 family protein n=1 Tax=Loktanella agnita TaxID=287097 RepID=UPI0039856DA0
MTPEFARRTYQEVVDHMLGTLSAQGILTDTAPGSVTRTLVEATSREFAELYARMNAVYEAGFLETATGSSLDQLVALIGLTRLSGETDIVEMRFERDNRVSARVIIPAGAVVTVERADASRVSYAVLDGDELRAGENTIEVALRALPDPDDPDADLSVNGDDVTLNNATFVAPIAGIASLSLVGPSVRLGTNETDEQLRKRARMAIASAGGGTEKALEQALMEIEGVNGVRLRDAGDPLEGVPLRPGEIEIILDGDPKDMEQVKQAIARAKGPGIIARLASTQNVEIGGTLVIRPASATLSNSQALELVRNCEALITETVDKLDIGDGLQWNRLLAALMSVENLGDILIDQSSFTLISTIDTQTIAPGDVSIRETQRLVPGQETNSLIVTLEDRPTLLIGVQLTADITEPTGPVIDQFTTELRQSLGTYLEAIDTSKPNAVLTLAETVTALAADQTMTVLTDQITLTNFSLTALETGEGSLQNLTSDGTQQLSIPQNAILRLADPIVSFTWEDPA